MPPVDPSHLVFVDFENVPSVDLALIEEQSVHVTLLIGEKQKRLDLKLVRQIHRHASQVTLIEVGASGRNALDLVLACHLGQAVCSHPDAAFHIISKDKDFNPLIAHLRANAVNIARHDNFGALPFLHPPRKAAEPDARFAKLISRLRNADAARPVRRKTLLSHVQDFFGNRLSESELESVITILQDRGVIRIDDKGHVSYEEPRAEPPPAPETFTYVEPIVSPPRSRRPRRPRRSGTNVPPPAGAGNEPG